MAAPMIGLAYWPLLLWIPLLSMQCLATMYLGRGGQGAVRSVTGVFVETPLCYFLKITWVVMLVLALDCLRTIISSASASASSTAGMGLDTKTYEWYQAKEGALVLLLNMVAMVAVNVIHHLNGEAIKLERDRDIMKRQAEQQAQFTKTLISSDDKQATSGVPKETTMPEKKKEDEDSAEMRKRD
eukprot:gnl/TRDRNA2_/TRDRNA2_181230_c0_seq1.p1 gnl/TRDRNA2_/TRDRNA2_181230_c0~~gnl/TRDRNA2_/TRDRNA2_181230_c0_seq1.p1  ORF type:complete len:185 (-),score=42.16 gnl/TRDRNA2_/TRDRNA2_181230_c0_seq1:116-670(-)